MTAPSAQSTWLDWFAGETSPPTEVMTRDELLEQLRRNGIDVNARTLMYWESKGVLPRPVRRYVGGSPKATYPAGWIDVVALVRTQQEDGDSLQEIEALVRAMGPGIVKAATWTTQQAGRDAMLALAKLAATTERVAGKPITAIRVVMTSNGEIVDDFSFGRAPTIEATKTSTE